MEFTAGMIAAYLGGEVEGDADAVVSTFAKIEEGRPGALSFLANPKYEHYLYDTQSSVVIVDREFEARDTVRATLVRVTDAYASFAKLLELYAAHKPRKKGISDRAEIAGDATLGSDCYVGAFAVVEAGARIGDNVCIYPNVYIGDGVTVGDNTTIYAGVKIYEGCRIGSNVIIHAGAVIGADGFGFAPDEKGEYAKIPQIGNVVVEDNVEIGANNLHRPRHDGFDRHPSRREARQPHTGRPQRGRGRTYRMRLAGRHSGYEQDRPPLYAGADRWASPAT